MRKDILEFAKEKYFNGHSNTRSVQGNFDLLTSFIQDSADKPIPSKTSRSVSSIPWITPEIRRKIHRKNETHAKAKKTCSSKLRSKFEILRREIKVDIRKQHDLYVNNLVGDVKANPRDFYRYINSQKKDTQGIPPLKRKNGKGVAQSDLIESESGKDDPRKASIFLWQSLKLFVMVNGEVFIVLYANISNVTVYDL